MSRLRSRAGRLAVVRHSVSQVITAGSGSVGGFLARALRDAAPLSRGSQPGGPAARLVAVAASQRHLADRLRFGRMLEEVSQPYTYTGADAAVTARNPSWRVATSCVAHNTWTAIAISRAGGDAGRGADFIRA